MTGNRHRIQRFYTSRNYMPLEPSAFVDTYGLSLANHLRNLFSALLPGKLCLLSGYYAHDVNLNIVEVYPSLFENGQQETPIISCNMLLFELMFDLLRFDKYRDTPHFFAIFGKYMKLLVGETNAVFSQWLHRYDATYPTSEKDADELMLKTIAAINFIVLHEYVHLQEDLAAASIKLLNETEAFYSQFDGLSEGQIEEMACDYSALYLLASPQFPVSTSIKNSLHTSATDSLIYGILMSNADSLLQILKCCFYFGAKSSSNTIDQIFETLSTQLLLRTKALILSAKLTKNTAQFSLGDLDIQKAFEDAHQLISSFFHCCKDALDQIEAFLQETAEPMTLTPNNPIDIEKIWYYIK